MDDGGGFFDVYVLVLIGLLLYGLEPATAKFDPSF